jgi:transposase InsO family protein
MSAAVLSHIPLPAPLKTTANLAVEWKRFKGQWINYVKATKISREEKDCQAAIFLACIGTDAYNIYTTMQFDDEADKSDPEKLIDAFEKHCIGEINEVYERYVFHRRQQEPGELFDTFLGDLRRLAKTCGYGTVEESTIRDRIVLGIRDDMTRKKLLQTRTLDLAKAIDICRSSEVTTRQLKDITSPDELKALKQRSARPSSQRSSSTRYRRHKSRDQQGRNRSPSAEPRDSVQPRCKYCNGTHKPSKDLCKAYGVTCAACGKKNHFASICRSKQSNEKCDSLIEESLLSLRSPADKRWYMNAQVDGLKMNFLLDTGSTANVIPMSALKLLHRRLSDLKPSRSTLSMFDNTKLHTFGILSAQLTHNKTKIGFEADFYVAATETPILGVVACQKLDAVRFVGDNVCEARELTLKSSPPPTSRRLTEAIILEEYADVFDGRLGLMEGDVHLEVDQNVQPIQMPLRRLPIALHDRVEAELRKLVDDEIIAPVTKPTPWVSALLVTTRRDNSLRVCIDPLYLNRALQRSTYYMPTIDDVLPKLCNAKVFSTMDAKSAFHQLKLDESSSYLTTFESVFGRYRWLRCPYGISPAPEIFQQRFHSAISGLNGIHCIADDILIAGSGDTIEAAEMDHDKNLRALLDRCREKNIKLNREKIQLHRESISYMGHVLTSSGMRPDPQKIEAIIQMPIPNDKKALQRALGMMQFLGRYCPNYSTVTAPLREMLHHSNEFHWTERHTQAFDKLKEILVSNNVLAYYSPSKELLCQCDSSQSGLGAALMQDGKVIEYASRALSQAETQYAQIEKELLSIVFALNRFDTYCYGRRVIIETDHKPLLSIYKKSLAASPRRLQRMWLKLQRYDFELVCRKSSEMHVADTLSRAYPPAATQSTEFPDELASLSSVDKDQMVELQMVASLETIALMKKAAVDDMEYNELIQQIARGWPDNVKDVTASLRPYYTFADELSVSCGLVFKGQRIVIPQPARSHILHRLHAAHTGVNACLRRAREIVYWPNITADIRRTVESCVTCASHQQSQQKEPLMSHPAPSRPWEKVGLDIFTVSNHDYLVTVCYLTGWFEIDRLPSKAITNVIYCLRQHFARHGLPLEVVSDNSPFASAEFKRFAEKFQFRHVTSSPRYPQSNGKAESAVKIAKKLMIRANETNSDPFLALLEWRNTPSEQFNKSPAQLILGRRTRTCLPICSKKLDTPTSNAASQALTKAKARQALYYNRTAKERPALAKGDTVRVKFDDRPEWRKAEIAKVLPHRSYEVRFGDGTVRRRTSKHVRFSHEPPTVFEDFYDDSDRTPAPANHQLSSSSTAGERRGEREPEGRPHSVPPPVPPPLQTVTTRSGRMVKRPSRFNS